MVIGLSLLPFYFFSLEINNVILGDTMNKKILVILTFFILIAGMSTACAFNFNDFSNVLFGAPKGNVTLAGVDFAIPNGLFITKRLTIQILI